MDGNGIVFLLDVDNTLLDNDRVTEDLRSHLERSFGVAHRDHYCAIFEELRAGSATPTTLAPCSGFVSSP
jgi:hypothetical protein